MKGCLASRAERFFVLFVFRPFSRKPFHAKRGQAPATATHFPGDRFGFFFCFSVVSRSCTGGRLIQAHLFICQQLPSGPVGIAGGHTISSGAGGSLTERSQALAAGTIGR
jgi:hypothetical protein